MPSPEGKTAASPKRGARRVLLIAAGALALAGAGVVVLQRTRAGAEHEPAPVAPDPGVVEFEPFVLNLTDATGDRYFRIVLRLVLDRRAIAERAASGLAHSKLRDHLLTALSRKRAGEMTSEAGREVLRAELVAATEALLGAPPFHDPARDPAPAHALDVYFTEFLVQ